MKAVVPIHRLRGTVLGLVAFGQIPQLVAPKAQAFGIRVVTYDPYVSKQVAERAVVCDLCSAQYGQRPACVTACPHDAAMRVNARFEFPVR